MTRITPGYSPAPSPAATQRARRSFDRLEAVLGRSGVSAAARLRQAGVPVRPDDPALQVARTALRVERFRASVAEATANGVRRLPGLPDRREGESLVSFMQRVDLAGMRVTLLGQGMIAGPESDYEVASIFEARESVRAAGLSPAETPQVTLEGAARYVDEVSAAVGRRSPAQALLLHAAVQRAAAQLGVLDGGVYALRAGLERAPREAVREQLEASPELASEPQRPMAGALSAPQPTRRR